MSETETRKEKGAAQLKEMIARWKEKDGEFRSYLSWRVDNLKLLGAGNSSGLFAVAVFLTTGTRTDGILTAAKACLTLFFMGFSLFFFAYRILYRCAGHIEDALVALRTGSQMTTNKVLTSITRAIDESERSGVLVLNSTICFVLASVVAFIGLLRS
jgi:hypothetical protein